MPARLLLVLSLALVVLAALPAVTAAQAPNPDAQAAQPPEEPSGEPQPGTPEEPDDGVPPETPGAESPATEGGGLLPRTGLGAGWIALLGIALLFVGIRLRVLTRIKEVVQRYVTPRTRLRESLEELRAAGVEEERRRSELGPQVEPSTPTGRRMADVR